MASISKRNIVVISILTLLGLVLIGALVEFKNQYAGNLIAESTGLILEILIVVLIFEKWQEHEKKEKLIRIERRLREYLIFFLKHNFRKFPPHFRIGNFYGADHHQNDAKIKALIHRIKEKGLRTEEVEFIKSHCAREQASMTALLPVAAELSNEHFKSWSRLVYFVGCIVSETEPIEKTVVDILTNINRFDSESFNKKIYVGAEK